MTGKDKYTVNKINVNFTRNNFGDLDPDIHLLSKTLS